MLTNKKITALFIIFLAVIFLLPDIALAQDAFGINNLSSANLGNRSLEEIIAGIINIFLGFLGILATLIMLYGGFVWMTSGGNVEKISKAKRIIINGTIGLLIILSSYAIARFILKEGYDGIFGSSNNNINIGFNTGVGLGAGALDSHYPGRSAKDVARNTNIYLTFKEPMNVDMMVEDTSCGGINCNASSNIELYKQGDNTPITGSALIVSYSVDPNTGFRSFQLNPANDLGDNTADVNYSVRLGDLETGNGSVAFPYTNSYSWIFTTGTDFDFTPPTVTSVRPVDGSIDNPRNSVVQINFSEAINPAFATGVFTGVPPDFTNISVTNHDVTPAAIVAGEYKISNQYRTVELITTDFCGVNSCGGDVFCLPASDTNSTDDFIALVEDSVRDMADNILDGDGDSSAGGDYAWAFATNNDIDLTPPTISHMDNSHDINLTDPIGVTFNKEIMTSSVNSNNFSLTGGSVPVNYWAKVLPGNIVSINHDKLDPSSYYYPELTSGIKDLRQNCWFPSECNAGDSTCVSYPVLGTDCPGTNCVGQVILP